MLRSKVVERLLLAAFLSLYSFAAAAVDDDDGVDDDYGG